MSDINDETETAIREIIADQGYPPSMRQLGKHLGLTSTDSVRERLISLERAGRIVRDPGVPRGIRLVEDPAEWLELILKKEKP